MALARPFPFPETTTAPRTAAAAVDSPRPKSLGQALRASVPVLARIPDITIGLRPHVEVHEEIRAGGSARTEHRYRLDAAHASLASTPSSRPAKARRALKRRRRSTGGGLEQLSASIRLAVNAWEFLQPYQQALKTAAMFLLMAASSMSVMLMMGQHWKPSPAPPQPTAASAEPTISTKPATNSAEVEHDPEGATTMIPTATGPSGPMSHSSEAIAQVPATVSVVNEAPAVSTNSPPSEPLAKPRLTGALAARGPGAKRGTPTSYPTTPYPVPSLPAMDVNSLPQARMSEPAPAVARLRGDILESQPR